MIPKKAHYIILPLFILAVNACDGAVTHAPSSDISIGLAGGWNMSAIHYGDSPYSNGPFGPFDKPVHHMNAGLSVVYRHAGRWGIQTGLRWRRSGGKSETLTGTGETGDILGSFWFVQDTRLVEIPLLLHYYPVSGNLQPFVFAGTSYGFVRHATESLVSDFSDPHEFSGDILPEMNDHYACLEFGLGLRLPVTGRLSAGAEASFLYGLTNQIKHPENDAVRKMREGRVSVTLDYRLFGL